MNKSTTLPNLNLIQLTLLLSLGIICQGFLSTPYLMILWSIFFFFYPPLTPCRSVFLASLTALLILISLDFSSGLHWNRTLFMFAHYFLVASIYFYTRCCLNSSQRKSLSIVIIGLLIVNCLGSVYQVFVSPEIQPLYWVPEGSLKRAFGLFDNPNLLATCLMMVIFVAYKYWRDREISVLPLLLLLITLLLTQSRGAILGLALGLSILFYYENMRIKAWILILGFVCVVGFSNIMDQRSLTPAELGVNQRVELLKGIQNYLKSEWLTGSGAGTFHLEYPFYRTLGGKYPLYAHNHILEIWCELGIAGLILTGVWIIFGLRLALFRRKQDPILLAFIMACLVNSSTNQSFSYFVVASIFAICLALVDEDIILEGPRDFRSRNYIWFLGLIIVGLLAFYQFQWSKLTSQAVKDKTLPFDHFSKINIFWKQDSKLYVFFCDRFADDKQAREVLMDWGQYLRTRYPREAEIPFQMAAMSKKERNLSKSRMFAYQSLALDSFSERYTAWLMRLEYDRTRYEKVINLAEKVIGSNPQYEGINPWYDKIYELYLSSLVLERRWQRALNVMETKIRWVDKNLGERLEQVIRQHIEMSNPKLMR